MFFLFFFCVYLIFIWPIILFFNSNYQSPLWRQSLWPGVVLRCLQLWLLFLWYLFPSHVFPMLSHNHAHCLFFKKNCTLFYLFIMCISCYDYVYSYHYHYLNAYFCFILILQTTVPLSNNIENDDADKVFMLHYHYCYH